MKKQLAKFALTAVLGLAITLTLNACEEKEKKQDSTTATEPTAAEKIKLAAASTLTDTRDSKTYKTVKIGSQTWMAENLNIDLPGSVCDSCQQYGRKYNWETAMKACPNGWHLPTKKEYETLRYNVPDISEEELIKKLNTRKPGFYESWWTATATNIAYGMADEFQFPLESQCSEECYYFGSTRQESTNAVRCIQN